LAPSWSHRTPRGADPDGADPDVPASTTRSICTTRGTASRSFHTAFGLPFAIFLLRNFFVGLPKDILESARIDGANEIVIFVRLILPARAARDRVARDLPVPLDVERPARRAHLRKNTTPITVWISGQLREFGTSIDIIAPASFISLIVPLAVFFAFQRYFVQGLLAGSVK